MTIAESVSQLGAGPLTEELVSKHLRPLFARTLAHGGIYLANHTLGRPLDAMLDDVTEGAGLWGARLRGAWEPWLAEEASYRAALAALLGMDRADCVVPKVSAGQALRAVLNTLPDGAAVLTTRAEFASVAVVLRQYAELGRLRVVFAEPEPDGRWTADCIAAALGRESGVRLVVVSHVFYAGGRVFKDVPALAAACRARGAALLLDSYHALGVLPFCFAELGCDYLIAGCYKYLRGGPGAAFLAIGPGMLDHGVRTLDVGWFAEAEGAKLRPGGDGWLDGTPAVLPYYQARSGLALTRALGVERLRAYSLGQLSFLVEQLTRAGVVSEGGDAEHGAFLTISTPRAPELVRALGEQGIVVDERGGRVRVCPDLLTTRADLEQVAASIAVCLRP